MRGFSIGGSISSLRESVRRHECDMSRIQENLDRTEGEKRQLRKEVEEGTTDLAKAFV